MRASVKRSTGFGQVRQARSQRASGAAFIRSAAVGAAAIATGLLLLAAPASALSKHALSTSITGSGTNALSEPADVAVDQSTGDIYIVDAGNFRVEKFTPSGEFVFMVGQEVDKTKSEQLSASPAEKDLCTAASGHTCQPAPSRESCCGNGRHSGVLPGSLANPVLIAVDNSGGLSAGDFYVVSSGVHTANYISKFDPAGHLITSWAEEGQQKLSNGYSSFIKQHIPPGAQVSEKPVGALVDEGGDLVFSTSLFGSVFRLGQFGSFVSAFSTENTMRAARLALGPGNDLLAAGSDGLHRLSSAGVDLGLITGPGFSGPPTAFATDLANGQTYVADAGTVIRHYGAACEPSPPGCVPTDSFGSGELGDVTGLSVDESTGTVYAADAGDSRIEVFAPTPFLPEVLAGTAAEPTATAVTLTGHVDPAGAGGITECSFEYLSQEEFEADRRNEVQTVTISGATGGTFSLGFEGHSTGATGTGDLLAGQAIVPNVATSSGAFERGEEISGPGIPAGTTILQVYSAEGSLLLSEPAGSTINGASLTASLPFDATSSVVENALAVLGGIGAAGVEVSGSAGGPYTVEFRGPLGLKDVPQLTVDGSALTPGGATSSVETTIPAGDGWSAATNAPCATTPPSSLPYASPADVHAPISGLTSETTYRYRLAAVNGNGTELSSARTFTPHIVVGLTTEPPIQVSGESATLEASLIGNGEEIHYRFEWGTTKSYGKETAVEETSAAGHQSLSFHLTGLSPNTTYHYRVVAENKWVSTAFRGSFSES